MNFISPKMSFFQPHYNVNVCVCMHARTSHSWQQYRALCNIASMLPPHSCACSVINTQIRYDFSFITTKQQRYRQMCTRTRKTIAAKTRRCQPQLLIADGRTNAKQPYWLKLIQQFRERKICWFANRFTDLQKLAATEFSSNPVFGIERKRGYAYSLHCEMFFFPQKQKTR